MFRAYDAERERLVAVKLFTLDLPPPRVHQLVAAFERLIAADLTHPALATPLATGITSVSPYLASDYVAAESLDLAVREFGPASPADALRVAVQLAGALDFAAVVDIMHGAVHPRDVLMSADETRLTGMGVARALEQVGVTAPVRRPYSAPERMAGSTWDRRADIFSLAALIHELLWGRRVTGVGRQAADALTEIAGGDLAALKRAFARALAEKPQERFDTALEFADALKQGFPGMTISPPPPRKQRTAPREKEPRLPLDEPDARADLMLPPDIVAPRGTTDDFDIDALGLKLAEDRRYADAEVAPAIVDLDALPAPQRPRHDLAGGASGLDLSQDDREREPLPRFERPNHEADVIEREPLTVLDRSRSAVWPLLLALMIGVALGFAAGYGVGMRERPLPVDAAAPRPVEAPPAAAASREFTEGTVPANPVAVATSEARSGRPGLRSSESATGSAGRAAPPVSVPASAAGPGRLLVRSTPAGARAFVDDRDVGRTPATVGSLTTGPHRVRVTRDGYTAEERRIVISRARPTQSLSIALEPSRTNEARGAQPGARTMATPSAAGRDAGALVVISRPPGATVFLDGRLVGSTPLSMPAVAPGQHAIHLERDGYRRWASSVQIVGGEQNRVTASLER